MDHASQSPESCLRVVVGEDTPSTADFSGDSVTGAVSPVSALAGRMRMWWNTRRNNSEFRRLRTVLKSMPSTVFIDTGNVCNLHCELCPSGQGKIVKRGFMSLGLFRRVVSVLGPTARQIHLYNWGEPLLNPHIVEMAEIAARFPAKTYIATNLNVLHPGQADGLVRSGLDVLNISLDGATQESYQAYRKGGELAKVLVNLRQVAEARRRCRRSRMRVRWQFLINRKNQQEVEQAREMAREIDVEFKTRKIRVGLDEFDQRSLSEVAAVDQEWLPEPGQLNRYSTERTRLACDQLWNSIVINFDGSVAPCCQIYKESQCFAESFDGEFQKIWNGPDYVAVREMFASGKVSQEAADSVCHACRRLGNVL